MNKSFKIASILYLLIGFNIQFSAQGIGIFQIEPQLLSQDSVLKSDSLSMNFVSINNSATPDYDTISSTYLQYSKGVVSVSPYCNISIYRTISDTIPYISCNPRDSRDISPAVCPLGIIYPTMYYNFRCLEYTDTTFKIVVNEEINEIAWLKQSTCYSNDDTINSYSHIEYRSWSDYYRRASCIAVDKGQTVYQLPSIYSDTVNMKNCFYEFAYLVGDWMNVSLCYTCYDDMDDPASYMSGWIKWFANGKPIVTRMQSE